MANNKQQILQAARDSSKKAWSDVAELKKELRKSEKDCASLSQKVEGLVKTGKDAQRLIEQTKRDIATWAQSRNPPHEKVKRARQALDRSEKLLEDSNKIIQADRHELRRLSKTRDALLQKIHRTESQARENDMTISQITAELEREKRQAEQARAQQAARTKHHHSNQQPTSGHVQSSKKITKPAKAPSHPTSGHSLPSRPPAQPAKLNPHPTRAPVYPHSGYAQPSAAAPAAQPAFRPAPQPAKPMSQPVKHSGHHASNHAQPSNPASHPIKHTAHPPSGPAQSSSLASRLFKRNHKQ